MPATSPATDTPRAAAASASALQNSSSREMLVRWPATAIDRFTGPPCASAIPAVAARRLALQRVEPLALQLVLGVTPVALRFRHAEARAVLGRLRLPVLARLALALLPEIDDLAHRDQAGPIIFSGLTMASNSASVT